MQNFSLPIVPVIEQSNLEKAEVLDENDLITKETFENYGKETLDFYKIDENKYYLTY